MSAILVRGVHAAYPGGPPVLSGVDLRVEAGESVALLGRNGGGKTTLLRVICGALAPTAGEALIGGEPAAGMPPGLRARRVAVLPQRVVVPAGMTARECVLLGRYAHLPWWGGIGGMDEEAADAALEEAGASDLADRRVDELSGGEAQRVALARVLAQDAPILLLDEPTAALDAAHETAILDVLERRRRAGAALVMIMHDCSLAALYATRLAGLLRGRTLFDGPTAEVFTEENLDALYGVSLRVVAHPDNGIPQALLAGCRGPGRHPGPDPVPGDPAGIPAGECRRHAGGPLGPGSRPAGSGRARER